MEKQKTVIRTISDKYQLTIPKRFGKDLGLTPPAAVTVTEDLQKRRIIIEPLATGIAEEEEIYKTGFVEACRRLGEKWSKYGVTEKDVEEAIRDVRRRRRR